MANTEVKRFNIWNGRETHSDYYDEHNRLVGQSVDRYDMSGKYMYTEHYDVHGNKTGTSKR